MTLYELTEYELVLLEQLENEEVTWNEIQDTFEEIDAFFEEKAGSYAKFINQLKYDTANLKTEIDRLSKKKSAIENKIKHLRDSLQTMMLRLDKRQVDTGLFKISLRRSSKTLEIQDESRIPKKYFDSMPVLNKSSLKQALENGDKIEGAILIQTETLVIK